MHSLQQEEWGTYSVGFSPDGGLLATAGAWIVTVEAFRNLAGE